MEKIIIDIETGDAPSASLLLEQRLVRPHANTKAEKTKLKQIKEKQDKLAENAALLDSSPILCIGTRSAIGTLIFVASLKPVHPRINADCRFYSDEATMLAAFQLWLDRLGDVQFIGHNIEKVKDIGGFDLPHLRFRYAFYNWKMPKCLDPYHTKSIDTMFLAWKSSHAKTPYISLDEIALRLGLIDKPFPIDGKDIPKLWNQGEFQACILKNLHDLLLTEQVYLRLSA